MRPLTTFLTATYNKPTYFREAAQSILNQTWGDWRWWVILDGADEETTAIAHDLERQDPRIDVFTERVEDRYAVYRPAILWNKYTPLVATKYFCTNADDDLKEPHFLETLVTALQENPDYHVVYGMCHGFVQSGDGWVLQYRAPADPAWRFGPGAAVTPDRRLNDGQVLQTKVSLDLLDWRLPTDFGTATHIDGVYMTQLARRFDFLFVDRLVHRCRHTHLSENYRGWNVDRLEQLLVPFQADVERSAAAGYPPGWGPLGITGFGFRVGDSRLLLEGWLAGLRPDIQRVWLSAPNGPEAEVTFRWQRLEQPDVVEALQGQVPEAYAVTGYRLLIDSPGATLPRALRLELADGSRCGADLPERLFSAATVTRRREILHAFGVPENDPPTPS